MIKSKTSFLQRAAALLACLAIFLTFSSLISQEQGRLRYDAAKIANLFPSSSRYYLELGGQWEKSLDGIEWESAVAPFTENNKSKIYYRKNLQIDPTLAQKYAWSLNFLGLDDHVEVYVNEQLVGKYFGGMTPFSVKIPRNLITGKVNQLKLVITPLDDISHKIVEQNIFTKFNSIGVIREVFLVGSPHIWVKDIYYKTALSNDLQRADVQAKVTVASGQISSLLNDAFFKDSLGMKISGKAQVEINASIKNKATGETVADAAPVSAAFENERAITLNFNFAVHNPQLWTPQNPNLYEISVKVSKNGKLIDDLTQPLGLYRLDIGSVDKKGMFLLNGSPFLIKGVDYIEDHIQTGQSLSPYRMEQDVILMKTLGVNLVRFKYNAPHPYFAYLCDKYGLFITIETPMYNVPSKLASIYEVQSRMKNIAERLTQNYDNHPCTFAYGLGEGNIEGAPTISKVYAAISKTIRASSSKFIFKNVLIGTKTLELDGVDFIGVKDSRKYLSYESLNSKFQNIIELANGKPLFLNYGFPIQINNTNGYTDPISVEAQRYYIMNAYNLVANNKIAGSIFWSFNDYKINNPLLTVNNSEQDLCSSGLFTRDRQQRLSYSTLQSIYTEQDEKPIFTAGSYSESTPIVFIAAGLITALGIALFTRRFKRFREYLFRALLRPYNFYADIRDQRIISVGQTFSLAFANAITVGLFSAALMYYFRSSDIMQSVLTALLPWKVIQEALFRLAWQPELFSLISAAFAFLTVFITAAILRLFSLFVKSRIYYTDTITIIVWASSPLMLLLPISIVMIKLLSLVPTLSAVVIFIAFAIYIWVIFRIVKSTAVVFDIKSMYAYGIGGGLIVLVLAIALWRLNASTAIFSYADYIVKYISNI
jgi:beta-galactosidase